MTQLSQLPVRWDETSYIQSDSLRLCGCWLIARAFPVYSTKAKLSNLHAWFQISRLPQFLPLNQLERTRCCSSVCEKPYISRRSWNNERLDSRCAACDAIQTTSDNLNRCLISRCVAARAPMCCRQERIIMNVFPRYARDCRRFVHSRLQRIFHGIWDFVLIRQTQEGFHI